LGKLLMGKIMLNDVGRMIQTVWDEIPVYYPGIDVDAFVVMPNHVHGIIIINEFDISTVGAIQELPLQLLFEIAYLNP